MRKIYIYLIILFFVFILNINFCYAATYYGTINGTSVRLREGAGTNYSVLKTLVNGKSYKMVSTTLYNDESSGCSSGWYQIYYDDNTTGYVCSSYVTVTSYTASTDDCEKELEEAGFPSSYWSGLCTLKELHSNWNFVAIITNLDWEVVVENESACGKSLIQTSNSTYIDSSCSEGYSNWYPASKTAVAYYMDPRNWLTEEYIFQFEYLKYDSNLSSSYETAIETIINGASFYTYHASNGIVSYINEAGYATDVNPIFLASRMLQELGKGTSEEDLYSGVYTGYDNAYYGYYNFFNYGVSDSCATTYGTAYCGLSYAKNQGWNSIYNAISGASSLLASNYLAVGQYTTYLQKFNVVPTNSSKIYIHQYMTNVAAPSAESYKTFTGYSQNNLLNSAFTFYIPVYLNMDETINNTDSGGTSEDTEDGSDLSISYIVSAAGFTLSGSYIYINNSTEVDDVISSIKAISGNAVTVKDNSSNSVSDGVIGTGYKITVKNNTDEEELTVVVKGDTSGDGKINALDLLQVQKYILGTYSLTDAYFLAGDTSSDSKINALDLLQVQKHILGTYTIE